MTAAAPAPAEAYPLAWPPGRPRTPPERRARAKFHAQRTGHYDGGGTYLRREGIPLGRARDLVLAELRRLGAGSVVLSSNLELRRDGLPLAGARKVTDPGVAVYFAKDGAQLCFACDRWDRVEDNLVAVAKTVEALRGVERWGTGDMVRAAFRGFQAIADRPSPGRPWWEVLNVPSDAPTDRVLDRYAHLARVYHPDRQGDQDAMAAINDAYEEFKRERGL